MCMPRRGNSEPSAILLAGVFLLSVVVLAVAVLNQEQDRVTTGQVSAGGSIIQVPSGGNGATLSLGVFSNQACTQQLTSVDWGTLEPGQEATIACYVKNTSAKTVIVTASATSWNPAHASNYLSFQWNLQNAVIEPGAVTQAWLKLQVDSNIQNVTSFSFNIIITATQA